MSNLISPSAFKLYFNNTVWLIIERLFRLALGVVVSVYVAKFLGPKQFGELSYVYSFVGIFSVLVNMGVDQIVVRDLVNAPHKSSQIILDAFLIKVIGMTAMWGSIGVALLLTGDDYSVKKMVAITTFAASLQIFNVIEIYFQAIVKSKYVALVQIIQFFFSSCIKLLLVWKGSELIWFVWMYVFDAVFMAAGLLYVFFYKFTNILSWNWRSSEILKLLRNCWPVVLASGAIMIQARIDQVMINMILGPEEVGQYSVALKMIEIFGFVPMVVCSSLGPAVTNAKKKSEDLYHSRLLQLYRLMFLLFLVTSIPIFILSTPVIVLLFGEAYRPAGVLFALFAIRLFFTNYGVAKGLFITNSDLFRYSLISAVVGATSNVLLNYLLIPLYQSQGAILATIFSFFLSIFVLDFFNPKCRKNGYLMMLSVFTFWKLDLLNLIRREK